MTLQEVKDIGILLFNDVEELDAIGPWEVLSYWTRNPLRTASRCRACPSLSVSYSAPKAWRCRLTTPTLTRRHLSLIHI